ncbi:unnamed protein product, partial [Effrenium voratum]
YVASTATLQCDRGQLAPSQFACAEESCAAPWNAPAPGARLDASKASVKDDDT